MEGHYGCSGDGAGVSIQGCIGCPHVVGGRMMVMV